MPKLLEFTHKQYKHPFDHTIPVHSLMAYEQATQRNSKFE